jgi:hypothetical protein
VGIYLEAIKNVRFCPVKEIFLSSFCLYVNVLEQAGGIVVLDGLSFFGGKLVFGGHLWVVVGGRWAVGF